MPMYNYFCATCNLTIERYRSMIHRHHPMDCPGCNREMKFIEFPQDSAKLEGRNNLRDPFRKI